MASLANFDRMERCGRLSLYFLILICIFGSSCRVWNPNQIFRTNKSYNYSTFLDTSYTEYELNIGDLVEVRVFTNDGYKLVDAGLGGDISAGMQQSAAYLIESTGHIRLPKIDTIYVQGLSVTEASRLIEEAYKSHLVEPFVTMSVANRRVFVFNGDDPASVVPLTNEHMTLFEVLALAGGVPATGKAYKIKLVRGDPKNPSVYLLDIRDPSNIAEGNIKVRANDVIIVDPTFETTLLTQITPIFALLTSAIAIYGLFITLNNQ